MSSHKFAFFSRKRLDKPKEVLYYGFISQTVRRIKPLQQGGTRMKRIYRLMDRIFDPLPKDLKNDPNYTDAELYYQSQDESYRRYKHLCYRNLILEFALAFFLGLLLCRFLCF